MKSCTDMNKFLRLSLPIKDIKVVSANLNIETAFLSLDYFYYDFINYQYSTLAASL